MEHLTSCPVCKNTSFLRHLSVKDYFLSNEVFNISKCASCGFLFTNPRPDQGEVLNYYKSDNYISHGNSNHGIIGFIYKMIRKYSLYKKYQLIDNLRCGNSILDIGCGTGEFLSYFKQKGWKTFGIEPVIGPREFAKKNFNLEIESESFLDELLCHSFDVITMWHVLEHVNDINNRISQIKNILKKDGLLVFALPNNQSWDCKHYESLWAAWDVPRHLSHFSQSTFHKLMKNHDLEIIKTVPMVFDSFYVSLLSEKYRLGSNAFFLAVKKGIKSNLYAKKHFNDFSSLVFLVKPAKN